MTLLMPAAISLLVLAYYQAAHLILYYGSARFGWWILFLLIPPVAVEVWFTKTFEVKRRGWRFLVMVGMALRLLFTTALFGLFIGLSLWLKNTTDCYIPLIGKWPYVVRFCWIATPKLSLIIAAVLLPLYYFVTVRLRIFRLATTVILPAAATLFLFCVLYFMPTSPIRMETRHRPRYMQQVYPLPGVYDSVYDQYHTFLKEVFVSPDDRFAMISIASTFGEDMYWKLYKQFNNTNVMVLDLRKQQVLHFETGPVRRFFSECPERIFFAPWHEAAFYEYNSLDSSFRKFKFDFTVNRLPVEEILFAYHVCSTDTLYMLNNRNPVLIVWDTRANRKKKVVNLVGDRGVAFGDSLWVIGRNRPLQRLYLLMLGIHRLAEVNEKTLKVDRFIDLPHDGYDVQVSPDGKVFYIPAFFKGVIWKLDAKTRKVVARFKAPVHCSRVALSGDGRLLFAGAYLTGDFVVYDARTGRKLLHTYFAPKFESLCVSNRYVYLLGAEGLYRISLSELKKHFRH